MWGCSGNVKWKTHFWGPYSSLICLIKTLQLSVILSEWWFLNKKVKKLVANFVAIYTHFFINVHSIQKLPYSKEKISNMIKQILLSVTFLRSYPLSHQPNKGALFVRKKSHLSIWCISRHLEFHHNFWGILNEKLLVIPW